VISTKRAMINGGRFTVPQQTLIIKNNFFYSKTVSDVTSETVLIKKNIFKEYLVHQGHLLEYSQIPESNGTPANTS
jgi:hypothetical protein